MAELIGAQGQKNIQWLEHNRSRPTGAHASLMDGCTDSEDLLNLSL